MRLAPLTLSVCENGPWAALTEALVPSVGFASQKGGSLFFAPMALRSRPASPAHLFAISNARRSPRRLC